MQRVIRLADFKNEMDITVSEAFPHGNARAFDSRLEIWLEIHCSLSKIEMKDARRELKPKSFSG